MSGDTDSGVAVSQEPGSFARSPLAAVNSLCNEQDSPAS
jgi:hypothetical protein